MTTPALEWREHPARRKPVLAVVALLLITLVSQLAVRGFDVPWWASLFIVALLVGSTSSFFFATDYKLNADGISRRHLGSLRVRPWKRIRRVEVGATHALLSPYATPRWLDRYRAWIVPLESAPDAAREMLRQRAAEAARNE